MDNVVVQYTQKSKLEYLRMVLEYTLKNYINESPLPL